MGNKACSGQKQKKKPKGHPTETNIIQTINEQKEIQFQKFQLQKHILNNLAHKKIAHKIFLKYTKIHIDLNFEKKGYGINPETIKFLSQKMESLSPSNSLNLNLYNNYFAVHALNSKYLAEALSKFTSLTTFTLNLSLNSLGDNPNNFASLATAFKNLKNVQTLTLLLNTNCLGSYKDTSESLKFLQKGILPLKNLQKFTFIMNSNDWPRGDKINLLIEALKPLCNQSFQFTVDIKKNLINYKEQQLILPKLKSEKENQLILLY